MAVAAARRSPGHTLVSGAMSDHKGTVVVTGASTGIGRATALRLAQGGFTVYGGVRKPEDGEALEGAAAGDLRALRIDVTDQEQIRSAAEAVSEAAAGAGIAGLVNNAGIVIGGPMEFIPLDDLRRQLEVNLIGQVAVTQAFMSGLRRARGRIVNVASVGGRVGTPFIGPYNASKFALEGISEALRIELRPWGIDVCLIEPGRVATEIYDKGAATATAVRERMPDEGEALYGDAFDAILKRFGKARERGIDPERVAKAIEHALTARRPKSRYLIGRDARILVGLSSVLTARAFGSLVERDTGLPRKAPDAD